ncbi:pentachlorophenol 4-monooxygenase [Pholiota conissans]|uniref:Pentachlorophenol 4-monooxygenase n=1 Tax=Pholiota conissans TaxID=109636 RepID=A0A9P5ZBY4_9AGAR|nr:pentachlorophenol 4-monooxygenase [Pholiota conissans]
MASTGDQTEVPKILIAGSGPSGLVLALTLRRNGVPVRVIEKSIEQRKGQRGAGIMPRSFELFEALGVYDQIMARALSRPVVMRMYKMLEGVEVLKDIQPVTWQEPTPSTPHINLAFLGQDSLDKILRAELAKYGCEVEFGTELVNFEQFDDRVEVKLLKHMQNGAEPITENPNYDWLIGADGVKSVVRRQLGLKLLGETITEKFVTGDAKVEGLTPDKFHIWGEMSNMMVMIRGTENEGIFNFILGGTQLEDPEAICVSEDSIRAALKKHIGNRQDVKIREFTWVSPFRVNIRMTESFGEKRVFLVGDAGHVHSPAGGQGMNTSIQDAYNLGWKLALVAKGLSAPTLLETYTEERFPVVAQMLKISTALLKKTIAGKDEGWNRDGNINQLGVNYRWSSIVIDDEKEVQVEGEEPSSYDVGDAVRAGDRAPDAPRLALIGKPSEVIDSPARLFKLFSPARHTVLVFSAIADYQPVLDALQDLPRDLVRTVIITPTGKGADIVVTDQYKTIVVEDTGGHARDAYMGANGTLGLFVIRPDGVIGARVGNVDSVQRYFKNIF